MAILLEHDLIGGLVLQLELSQQGIQVIVTSLHAYRMIGCPAAVGRDWICP